MARIHDVVFDCRRPAPLARFWASALDGYQIAAYDEAEIERLREAGIDNIEDDPAVLVEEPGVEPRLFFQLVPESKVVKNRLHLDLSCDNLEAETARLVDLGANVTDSFPEEDRVVLTDHEGNEFCLSA